MLTLLEDHFENESSRLASDVIGAVLWDVLGTLGLKHLEHLEHLEQWIVIPAPNADSEQSHH